MSGRSLRDGLCLPICRASGSLSHRPPPAAAAAAIGSPRWAKWSPRRSTSSAALVRAHTVRQKFTCRDCETLSEPPAPFHVIPRARIRASLLAMILFEKYGCHQPLNRQSERYAREGVDLDVSSLADHVGAGAAALAPLQSDLSACARRRTAARRRHDRPVLAKGKTITGRLWAYVRDDRPFGQGPPAVLFHYSRDRRGEHPESISPAMPVSCRPTPIVASASSMR